MDILIPLIQDTKKRNSFSWTMADGKLIFQKCLQHIDFNIFDRVVFVVTDDYMRTINEDSLRELLCEVSQEYELYQVDCIATSWEQTWLNFFNEIFDDAPLVIKSPFIEDEVQQNHKYSIVGNMSFEMQSSQSLNMVINLESLNSSKISSVYVENANCIAQYLSCSERSITNSADFLYHSITLGLVRSGSIFSIYTSGRFTDWSDKFFFTSNKQSTSTLFCDLDGVLFKNGGKLNIEGWKTDVITENVNALKNYIKLNNAYLIITTARPLELKDYVLSKLEQHGLFPDDIIMGLPHCKRILINDFAGTNPFPTAVSINLPRDSTQLKNYL